MAKNKWKGLAEVRDDCYVPVLAIFISYQVPQETERHCDICKKTVSFGTAGLKNWIRHVDGKTHSNNVQRVNAQASRTTLKSFFSAGRPCQSVPSAPAPSRLRLGGEQPSRASAVPEDDAASAELPPALGQLGTPFRQSRDPMYRLRELSAALPDAVPLATADDVLSGFAAIPMFPKDDDYDCEWEFVDKTLNVLLGYGRSDEDVASFIRRGPFGMDGLIKWLSCCLSWPGVTMPLLEGKIERLCRALCLK